MLVDDRFREILEKIGNTLREETRYDKNALNMLGQKCFAVKVQYRLLYFYVVDVIS